MNRNLFTPGSVKETVVELDSFRNDILGVAAFSFALTALQFQANQAPSIASVAFVFLALWATLKIAPTAAEHKRFYKDLGYWAGNFRALYANLVLFAGMLFLGFVAGGVLTLDSLVGFSFARMLGK